MACCQAGEDFMEQQTSADHPIVPREGLDFGLDGDIPRYWFENDPFKTRLFDAMSVLFPEGEKFFITCVRDFRDQVKDAETQQQVRDFIRQEGQHSKVHMQFNDRLKAQGVNVDAIEAYHRNEHDYARKHLSKTYTLAMTAAAEHMTAIMAHGFFKRELLDKADARMRALYHWHAIEEIEHKAVAFDIMQKVAGANYWQRCLAMLQVTLIFPLHTFLIMRHMFRIDGFNFFQRTGLWLRGLWWLYRPGGVYMNLSLLGHYFAYYRPGFHPWQDGDLAVYRRWLDVFNRTGDPIAAGNSVMGMV
jgi:hypothetical protein